ncbi:MAG: imidazole glycerol phosphate synthase subunit HisH [Cyclobacteriaceae bacterium]|nr:imidazole glycerol phosphate synthase subunit HisH [Cyclobacteriaceae bacterium]MCH8516005.1 imidazole glycerol phosphate synthase subunit HisH [Cyclobacteriaceae bacterium]
MKVAIIKYNAGNIRSVEYALQRLGVEPIITDDHHIIQSADKVIFPGVGSAGSGMKHIQERQLDQLIPSLIQPVLGVCFGLQLMCTHSEEDDTPCLGIFDLKVKKFKKERKVPHMGWNSISFANEGAYAELSGEDFYFVHSYYAEIHPVFTVGHSEYGEAYSAVLQKDNFTAIQAHPEKSAKVGARFLEIFLQS